MIGTEFRVEIDPKEIDDLRERLLRTRWAAPEPVDDWSQGVPLDYAKDVASYWVHGYDMNRVAERINVHPQFLVEIDGVEIHVLHARSPHAQARPLVITHGWPGSVVEFLDVIPMLTDPPDPADAFHVVCPTLPGFGFSGKPTETGWTVQRIARAWAQVMAELGYDRYWAQGGDWGSFVTGDLGAVDPDHVAGIHMTLPRAPSVPDAELSDLDRQWLADAEEWRARGQGYSAQQSTRPQTIGYGLVDSPAAQLTWILDKFWAWTDNRGDLESVISRDVLLDNVMLYWLPGAGVSSARIYWENFPRHLGHDPVRVPMGASFFPREVVKTPRPWLERRFSDIRYFNTDLARGGHFPSLEVPKAFVAEVRACFRLMP
ncbi:epoxide hydrolase family protein [Sporichthya polymorpha]|uniref:epoxide hydrolase family protein n=1 Tax=Sporichthya polymorpha TaxID=35751 RepID=UPI00037FF2B3|nr:epoxide hydrolase [Sporichthya polymorpha]